VEAPPEVSVSHPANAGTILLLQVTFQPKHSSGWREGKIKIHLKGLLRQEVALPFKALVEGVIDTEPNFLNFGIVAPGESKDLEFRIINRAGKHVKLKLDSHPQFVQVTEVKDKVIWLARLRTPFRVSQSKVISGKIVFRTNLPVQPLLEVPVFAAVENRASQAH
jgi:hypothetical protein